MNKTALRKKWMRILGPVLSILAHVLIVVVLLHTIGFMNKPEVKTLQFDMTVQDVIDFDELLPVDPPELKADDSLSPEPMSSEDLSAMTPSDDLDVAQADDSISMLDNLSPLTITGVGTDIASQGALTSRYGNRAVQNGLLGSYFNRVDFTGETFMRIDETLNYKWELESPWNGRVEKDLFSIIWTGRIVPPRTGTYTFYLQSDDGARLWIDGQLVLDQFVERERVTDEVKIDMLIGKSYDIKYAFCDAFRHAVSSLEWSCEKAGIPRQLVPSEHMWADGSSTRQMIAWNEEVRRGTGVKYPNRDAMRNPAMIEGQPFSNIVGFQSLGEDGISRLQLLDLADDFSRFKKSGRIPPSAQLPALPPNIEHQQAEPPAKDQDVIITVM